MHCTQQIHKPHNSTKPIISIQENVINISVNFGSKTKKIESFSFLFFQSSFSATTQIETRGKDK